MRARALVALLAVATSVVPACSDDDEAGGGDPGASTSTTVGATTSTTRPAAVRAVVVSGHGLLGWWEDGRWVQAEAGSPSPYEVGEEYALVPLTGAIATATARPLGEQPEFCSTPPAPLDPPIDEVFSEADDTQPVGVHGVEDPRPRSATQLDPDSPTYHEAATRALLALGVEDGDPEVSQVLRVDLEGDGEDEVLFVAERIDDLDSVMGVPGDYSILFLRKVIEGEVRTFTVADYRKTAAASDGPSPYVLVHRVSSIADLNGDGVMEVVVQSRYYEGSSTKVYAFGRPGADGSAAELEDVLTAGCGV